MKVNYKVYKLHFKTPLHIGDERADYSISLKTVRSDTLYAAFTAVLSKLGKTVPEDGDLGFTISSLFPFYQKSQKEKPVYFFPKLLTHPLPDASKNKHVKDVKKITWLDIDYFNKQINEENIFSDNLEHSHIKDNFLTGKDIGEGFMSPQISPRVKVSRSGEEDATPFYMDRLYFSDHSGMYFIAKGDTKVIEPILNVLKDEGIGTDRNIGNGFFEFSEDSIELDLPRSNFISNLSLFCPENHSQLESLIDYPAIAYDFIKRGGWITSDSHTGFRKNSIYVFSEGSVFKSDLIDEDLIMGKIVDLKPEIEHNPIPHPVWRNGRAIFIPVKPVL